MRLGIPDDYSEFFLADILTRFNQRHPLVEISVVCENSVELAALVHAGALELALVTDHEGLQGFELIREEPLRWTASQRFKVPEGEPIPLALGSQACIWRRVAEEALEGRRHTVRNLFASKNYTAVLTVVRAGLAVTVLPVGMIGDGLRALGLAEGLAAPAAHPHGPHPRARRPVRGGPCARRGGARDDRRSAPGGVRGHLTRCRAKIRARILARRGQK